jgi:Right handed beta helix region
MKRRAAVVLFAALAAIGLSLAPAGATGRHHHGHHRGVLVVDNEHRHRSCLGTRNPFQTIQSAVNDDDAVPGATIWVCPGLYEETVKVETPRLTLKGANAGRDATRSRRHRESVVSPPEGTEPTEATVQLLEDGITWDGFTILGRALEQNGPGMTTDPAHSGYLIRDTIFQDNGIGLRLAANGEKPSIVCRNRFVANNEFDPTGGYGIVSDQTTRQALITYNRFEDHNGGAILFSDSGADTHTDVLIDHNKSVRDLTLATIFSSTRLRLSHNDARNRLEGPADGSSSIFIGARNKDIWVHRNRVRSASGNGIDVTPSGEGGKAPAAPENVRVTKNKASGALLAGLHMAIRTAAVTVTGNTAVDNGEWDCRDDSSGSGTDGTANTWTDNLGVDSLPDGICAPPPPTTDKPGHGKGHHKKHKKKHKKQDPCVCQKHHPRAV